VLVLVLVLVLELVLELVPGVHCVDAADADADADDRYVVAVVADDNKGYSFFDREILNGNRF